MTAPTAPDAPPTQFSRADLPVIVACAISMPKLTIPAIARDFRVASTHLQWAVTRYMLPIGVVVVDGGAS
jgi:hypothetical protein